MCGIAGFISTRDSTDTRLRSVDRMVDAMRHRGPDDRGSAAEGPATLGMCRLAIFDPANGHQPIATPDGRHTLIFNGAIYNFHELAAELARLGWTFRTRCDTEVLLAAYAQWGADCLNRLRGMYSFAVWDRTEQQLFLARGPYGIKPLYYHWRDDGGLLFASELRALFASRVLSAEIDPRAVNSYLSYLSVPAPDTLFRRVRSLRPGQYAVWRDGRLEIRSYWSTRSASHGQGEPCGSYGAFVSELRERLDDSVRAHSIADVPVGAFLSGGLDSSAIVALMAKQVTGPLKTFTLVFDEPEFSEQAAARRTATHVGTEHHELRLTGEEVARSMPRILASMDHPTGDGINTYFASRLAAEHGVKVVVSGLGGDELFGGYPSFRQVPLFSRLLPWWRRLPRSARHLLLAPLAARASVRSRKLSDFLANARDFHELASLQRTVFSDGARQALLEPGLRKIAQRMGPFHPMLDDFAFELSDTGPLRSVSSWEMRTYMADVLLADSDVFSMAHSLELRTPYIDPQLVRWLWAQPEEYVYTPGRPKHALADAVAADLPVPTREQEKIGFLLPFSVWMRGPLKPFLDETFSRQSLDACPWLDASAVENLWRDYLQSADWRNWSRIWSLAMLIAFVNAGRHP